MISRQKEGNLNRMFVDDLDKLKRLDYLLNSIGDKHDMSQASVLSLVKKRDDLISIPASVFDSSLSPLESVIMYLRLKFELSQREIARLLGRDDTTIWTTLANAKKKMKKEGFMALMKKSFGSELIPLDAISGRKLSILESVSVYLRQRYSYSEIGKMLGKNERTIWTVVNRAKKK